MLKVDNKIISGKLIAEQIRKKIMKLQTANKIKEHPILAIIYIGTNKASEIYIKYKTKFATSCKVDVLLRRFQAPVTNEEIMQYIQELNNDSQVAGIMVQLPLPKSYKLDQTAILNTIAPNKDVDGLSSYSLGQCWKPWPDSYPYSSCTADACMQILRFINFDSSGKNIVIVGNTVVLGQPLLAMLSAKRATLTICNSLTANLAALTKLADVVVSATGVKNLIKPEMLKKNAIVIDVGINKDENNHTHGDVQTNSVLKKVAYISPSPGGVGPITIAMLVLHTVQAYIDLHKDNQ